MKKRLYCGRFNWYGEIFEVWRHASNVQRAHFLMIRELGRLLGVSEYRLCLYFNGSRDNYKIEKKRKEVA